MGINVAGSSGKSAIAVGIDGEVSDLIKSAKSASGETTPDDHGDTRGTSTRVALNRSVSGNIETEGDVDYFRFVINSTGTITASTTGNTDTYGRLENNSGNYITANVNSGSEENFLITRELNRGTYYIAVRFKETGIYSYSGSHKETGKYSLRVDFTEPIKLPDLAVDSVDVDSKSVVAGETTRVVVSRSNTGDKYLLTGFIYQRMVLLQLEINDW